jgi:4-carboxymuconolactone decarboxylase
MSDSKFERGLEIRRKVLGRDYVDAALKRAEGDDFIGPLQEIVTEHGWAAVWDRPGLDFKTRSLLTIAALLALNRPHELGLHVKGALNNGCTDEQIREVIIHTGCYCGWPSAVDGFRIADPIIKEHRQKEAKS